MDEIVITDDGVTEVLGVEPDVEIVTLDGMDQEVIFVGDAGIQGIPGTSSIFKSSEPAEAPDGVRTEFSVSDDFVPASLQVFINGLLETHVTVTADDSFEFSEPPIPDDEILAFYCVQ